jgi:queuine tRNA-ribosyltransferase
MSPEDSVRIQSCLGSDIAMAFDECVGMPAEHGYAAAKPAGGLTAGLSAARPKSSA